MNRSILLLVAVVAFAGGAWYVYQNRAPEPAESQTLAFTPPGAPVGATLLPGLGNHSFAVTSTNADVQKWFDQGLALAYGFNHDASERSFLRATELDPNCAMCWWGAALVLGPHVNAPMDPGNNAKAWVRIAKAVELSAGATEREQAFIAALDVQCEW